MRDLIWQNVPGTLAAVAGFGSLLSILDVLILGNYGASIFYGPILAPIALVSGLIGLFRRPRSLAIAGIVMGILFYSPAIWSAMYS